MLKEFKQFVLRGNVIDLAVGVIIGGAFGAIVNSLINDVITPLLLKPLLDKAGINELGKLTAFGTVKYGSFLAAVISFLLVAFVLFIIIKAVNSAKRKEEVKPPPVAEVPADIKLLTEIRDLLNQIRYFRPEADREPAVAKLDHSVKGGWTITAHQDRWMRFLCRLWMRPHLIEVDELAVKLRFFLGPYFFHREHSLS